MTIRKYQNSDRNSLKSLIVELQNYMRDMEPTILDSGENIVEEFIANLLTDTKENPGVIFVAEEKGMVVGFVAGREEKGGDEVELIEKKCFYISNLSVLPDWRDNGIGTALLSEVEKYAKSANYKNLILNVLVKNEGAYNLYKKGGFRELEKVMFKAL